jgi:hypothetical protein
LSPAQGRAMSENARDLFRNRFTVDAMAKGLLEVVAPQ